MNILFVKEDNLNKIASSKTRDESRHYGWEGLQIVLGTEVFLKMQQNEFLLFLISTKDKEKKEARDISTQV